MKKKLQVFVSSTFEDLKGDRQAAVSAILKAGHIPAGMELFTAGDKSQMQTIRTWIEESDVYMLILGGRYGSVEPTSGVSYTELEYDYAMQLEKPLFAVVITDDALEARVRTIGSQVLEKHYPQQLAQFRQKVLSNISSFFSDDKDIRLCVYESLADFSKNRDMKGWVSSDELENSQQLLNDIERLKDENIELTKRLAELNSAAAKVAKQKVGLVDFDELVRILDATEITVPAKVSTDGNEFVTSLLRVLMSRKEQLITGVTNKMNTSELEQFLYFSVAPKLQIHELMINEKVASVMWRRFSITPKGIALLAHLEKERLTTE